MPPSGIAPTEATIADTIALAAPTTAADHTGQIVADTTAPFPGSPTTTEQPIAVDTGTVPQLVESDEVVSLELEYDGSLLTARFGPSTAGGVVVKVFADGQPIAGTGAPRPEQLEGGSTITFLPGGGVVIALVGAPEQPGDAVELVADGSAVASLTTGVWETSLRRLIVLAAVPAGTVRVDAHGVVDGEGIAFDLPADPSLYFPPVSSSSGAE